MAFRNAKQALGLEDPQNGWGRRRAGSRAPKKRAGPQPRGHRGSTAVAHTVPLVFVAHGLTVVWYPNNGSRPADVAWARRDAPWYTHKADASFDDMLAALRREPLPSRLSSTPLANRLGRKLRDLLPRWLLTA